MSERSSKTRTIEITAKELKLGTQTYHEGDIESFPKADADQYISLGWAKCVETGETGVRSTAPVSITMNDTTLRERAEANDAAESAMEWERERLAKYREEFQDAAEEEDEEQRWYGVSLCALLAIRFALSRGIPVPTWAATHFLDRSYEFISLNTFSLDKAFNLIVPSDQRARKEKQDYRLRKDIFAAAQNYQDSGRGIDWQEMEKDFSVSKTKLQKLYYRERENRERKARK